MINTARGMRLLFLLGITCQTYCYIRNIVVWEKDGRKVVGCGDVHDVRQFCANVSQCKMLRNNFGNLDCANTTVLAEDTKVYSGPSPIIADLVRRQSCANLLGGLIAVAQRCGVGDSVGLEYRQARQEALSAFIKYNDDTMISSKDVIEEFDARVAEIRQYQDTPCLMRYYKEQLASVVGQNDVVLNKIRNAEGALTSWIRSNVPEEKQRSYARCLECWDVALLDCKVLHEIVQRPDKRKIIIFAGAMHVEHVGKVLEDCLGYQRIGLRGQIWNVPYGSGLLDIDSLKPCPLPPKLAALKRVPLPADDLKLIFE